VIEMPAVADIGHAVQFYREEAELTDTVATFLADGIRDGGVSIAIATEAHRRAIDDALVAARIDPFAAREAGQLLSFDAESMLAQVMRRGRLDRAAFRATAAGLVPDAAQARRPARVFGEMASLLWNAGDVIGAIELETLCNELRRQIGFSMLCTYHGDALHDDSHADALSAACRLHSAVLGHFHNDVSSPGEARRLVANVLLQWGYDEELSESIALVVSELATNAVTHARSPFSVLARSDQQVIRISVHDESVAMPELREAGWAEGAGLGLQMVAALAGAWGVEMTAGGKAVWAQLTLKP
jgi:anti-sigma regulatory factor (Ser/Thr protein kinase)